MRGSACFRSPARLTHHLLLRYVASIERDRPAPRERHRARNWDEWINGVLSARFVPLDLADVIQMALTYAVESALGNDEVVAQAAGENLPGQRRRGYDLVARSAGMARETLRLTSQGARWPKPMRSPGSRRAPSPESTSGAISLRLWSRCYTRTRSLVECRNLPLPPTESVHRPQWRDGLLLVSDKKTRHEHVPTRSPLECHAIKDKRAEIVAKRHAFSFGFEDWNLERGTVRLVGPAVRGQVRCVNHPASMRLKAVKQHSRGGRRSTRPTTAHVRGDECACGKTKVVPITEVIRFYQPYVWGSPEWERAYGGRNLSETATATSKTITVDSPRARSRFSVATRSP